MSQNDYPATKIQKLKNSGKISGPGAKELRIE